MGANLSKLVGILAALLIINGCAVPVPKPQATLYERLGEKPAIEAVVNDFIDRVGSDPRITNERVQARLAAIHIPTLKWQVTNQVCAATGGPCEYTGRDMGAAHTGLKITNAEFDAVVDDLVKTLDKYKVPEQEKNELLALLGPMRKDIVQVQ